MTSKDASARSWSLDIEFPAPGRYEIVDLSHPLHVGIPHHPAHPPFSFTLTKKHGDIVYPNGVSGAAEMFTTSGHVGTHIDGFSHIACDGKVLGGHSIEDRQDYSTGMSIHSIEELPPFFVTAHFLDVPEFTGTEPNSDLAVDRSMLERWEESREATVSSGDVVLVRTGWDAKWETPREFIGEAGKAPGISLSGAEWLAERGVRAAGTDTIAFEKTPSVGLEVHKLLLTEKGISIIEAMNLRPLSGRKVDKFFLVFSPINLAGGTGSPIRPLAVL